MLKNLLCLTLFVIGGGSLFAQNLWTESPKGSFAETGTRYIVPQKYRTVKIDLSAAQSLLAQAPERFSDAAPDHTTVLQLPMPDGSTQDFRIYESSVMEPGLQQRFPEIRTYTGVGISDPTALLKCDLTPKGFHAMVLSANFGTSFIDPYSWGDNEHYISYYKKDYSPKNKPPFQCLTEAEPDMEMANRSETEFAGDCGNLRKYRLALSCTGEYAQFHGGTKPLVLAAMVQSINRINGVYEREMGVTLSLIANNDLLIYLTASSDPFSNNDGGSMLSQNQTTCNNVIGSANYDMGHVFSTGGGGVAQLGCICRSNKAQGVTGSGQPIGDPFDIDYVAHEMGHQFGANHTFNNSCGGNISQSTAMEPGSGSTIMGYAGICSPDVQNNSDDYFHAISLQEMGAYISTGTGNNCAQKIANGNQSPVVDAGANYTIPKSTPFALTATGSDPDNDPLTYCWEQMDPESGTMPPGPTNAAGPMFRSFDPVTSPTRYFPRLADVIANANPQWEKLPGVARNMKFRVTIRDNHAGGSCTEEDDMVVTVSAAAGPFAVTEPNTNVTWYVGEPKTITWNVNNTTAAPVSCQNVKISLSTDGGLTYPVVLASSVPNSGTADVTVPNNISTTCRVKVEAVGNVFYDISNQNFKIQAPLTPTFVLSTNTGTLSACAGEQPSFSVGTTALAGFQNPVQLSVSGLPAGATAQIATNPVTFPSTTPVNITLSNLQPSAAGTYNITVTGVSGTITQTTAITLNLLPGQPTATAAPSTPSNGATGVALTPSLTWSPVDFAQTYLVEVSSSAAFGAGTIVFSNTTSNTTLGLPALNGSSVYYWRLKASNPCGSGSFSPVYAFQTGSLACNQSFSSTNVPVVIDASDINTIVSNTNVTANKTVGDVNVTMSINHTYVGDLDVELISPSNDTVRLFDRPGFPADQFGCDGDNLVVTFDDEASNTAATFEGACGNLPAISGSFKSLVNLSDFDGENALGNWKLSVTDNYAEDGGSLVSWSLNFCFADPLVAGALLANEPLTVPFSSTANVPNTKLRAQASGSAAQIVYTLINAPLHGTLSVNGVTLGVGGTFTQGNIDGNQLAFQHNGDNGTSDSFTFDVIDQNNAAWLHNGVFNLIILQNSLSTSAAQSQSISCNNGNNGSITATATGGTPPLTYSINGGAFQASNVFGGLIAGSYSIVVKDANGFTSTTNSITLSNPSLVAASASVTGDDLSITASGGTGAYTYSIDGQTFVSSNVFENLANGVYSITVKDANNCTANTTAVVAVNSLLAGIQVTTPITCNGGTDGVLTVTAAGGQTPFEYSLNNGSFQTSNVFAGLAAGTYTVVVKDAFGLSITAPAQTINNPAPISAAASTNLNVITVTASGGTGNLQYSLDGGAFQQGTIFQNVANGTHNITVKDINGCTSSTSAVVNVAPLAGTASVTQAILCAGGTGNITANVTGGIPPYQYKIGNNPYQNSNVLENILTGNHEVTVKDATGSTFVLPVVALNQPQVLSAASTVLGNDLTVIATGGTTPYQFALNGNTSMTGVFSDLVNGNYSVVVTDANGCSDDVSANINYTVLGATFQSGQPTCNGATDGRILVTVSGGVAPYMYSTNGVNFQGAALIQGLAAGTYTITVKDAAGDIFVLENAIVYEPDPIIATASAAGYTVTVTAAGGTGNLQYSLDGGAYQLGAVFSNIAPGAHTITVRDQNACTTTASVTVELIPLATSLTSVVNTTCFGTGDGSALICANGGFPPYTITQTGGVLTTIPGNCAQNYAINGLEPGEYSATVTDGTGTAQILSFTITSPPEMFLTASTDFNDITTTGSGGTAPLEFSIDGLNYQSSNVFENLPIGTYTVSMRDANYCLKSVVVVLDYVRTVEPSTEWGLAITPNPSTGIFQVSVSDNVKNELKYSVFDTKGRLLRSFLNPVNTLDLSDLPNGFYFLRVSDGKNVGNVRLVIVR